MPRKILVADDDPRVLQQIVRFLSTSGLAVVQADNGSEALCLARESRPDLVLLDAEMPGLDGHVVCRSLKKDAETRGIPVVIMSGAMTSDQEVISGLSGGADDYVAKPFSLPVLKARLDAVMRRYSVPAAAERKLRKSGIELDPSGRTVVVRGRAVSLTRKEFDLLAVLISQAGRVLRVPYLLETVWGYDPSDYNDPGTVEVHVSHLRKKLGAALGRKIVKVHGLGYKFGD